MVNEDNSKKAIVKKELDTFKIKMINGTISFAMVIASGILAPIAGYYITGDIGFIRQLGAITFPVTLGCTIYYGSKVVHYIKLKKKYEQLIDEDNES